MPIPEPRSDETESQFISRCMGDDTMQEYEQKQRAAICYSTFRDSKKSAVGANEMRLYGLIQKVEPQDDGTIRVHGIVSTENEDDQGEIVRAAAMRDAIPEYMKFPALREMHGLQAAGTALQCDCGDDGVTRIVGHVVDPIAVKKIKNNVYRGFSIGGRVREREAGNYKTITKLDLHEISLVDRPANPEAVLDMWKAGGEAMPDGLGTMGDAFAAALAKTSQHWSCDDPTHRHGKKEDAARCMAKASGAEPKAGDETSKADAIKPTVRPKDSANMDGDDDEDDQEGGRLDDDDAGRGNMPLGSAPNSDRDDDPGDDNLGDPVGKAEANGADKKPYGDVEYADPGYRGGKKRYPIDTADHVRAAWSYVNMPKNARKYSGSQLASIKSKIRAAAKKHGIEIAAKVASADDELELATLIEQIVGTIAMLGDLTVQKAGRRQSAADHFLMNVAHDAIGKLADDQWCMKVANATQDTGDEGDDSVPQVTPPTETFRPGQNSTQDTSKRGSRHSAATMGYLKAAHDAMCKAGAFCNGGGDMSKVAPAATATESEPMQKTPGADDASRTLKKALKKALGGVHDEQAAMREIIKGIAEKVEAIAKQPMPALTAGVLPPGFAGVSKSQDGKGGEHMAEVANSPAGPDVEKAYQWFNSLSPEEQFRISYTASRDRPFIPQRR